MYIYAFVCVTDVACHQFGDAQARASRSMADAADKLRARSLDVYKLMHQQLHSPRVRIAVGFAAAGTLGGLAYFWDGMYALFRR